MNGGEYMDKDSIITEATKLALDEVREANEGRQKLTEDLLYRMVEKDAIFKRRLAWILPSVLVLQILTVLAIFVF